MMASCIERLPGACRHRLELQTHCYRGMADVYASSDSLVAPVSLGLGLLSELVSAVATKRPW
ncbi:unnamed protein product [Clonostachys chloroleuca]|uniref:Uncharacterized protein n=1 Tax=Clonostachys chloroleuca TaxID=1926264 RepID=A0AA35Q4I2_9HYPO|nr:unnamed protein product [Clonostachys chloroleuca]